MNGVFGAHVDSIPMIVVSGQVKRATLVSNYNLDLRQLGDQENDIISMVSKITKFSICLTDPTEIKYQIKKAIYLSVNGRPGPVWIDVPIDIQAMQYDESVQKEIEIDYEIEFDLLKIDSQIEFLVKKINESSRPVFYLGSGIHLSNTKDLIIEISEKFKIPIVTTFNSNDLIPDDNMTYVEEAEQLEIEVVILCYNHLI